MVIIRAKVIRCVAGAIALKYDPSEYTILNSYLNRQEGRGITELQVSFASPQQRKKTGLGTRLNAARGWCRDIADQLSTTEREYSAEEVWEAMKRMAVGERKWPTYFNVVDGVECPIPAEAASEEEMGGLCDTIKLFAATKGLWLTESVNGQPVKLYGGSA